MKAVFELLIRVLKWLPRPLVPLVPIMVTLLGPVLLLVVIVYSIHVPHGEDIAGWSSKARNSNGVASGPASGRATN